MSSARNLQRSEVKVAMPYGNNSVSVSALKQQFQDDIKDLETRLIAAISTSNEANKNTPSTRQPLQNPLNQRESS